MSQRTCYTCDRCGLKTEFPEFANVLVMPVPDGHISRLDVWKEHPSGDVDLCNECATSYRQWWEAKENA